MAQPEGSQVVKIGVVLARQPDDLGGWLADGAAFDAAGADALWIDSGPDAELDPLVLTAALAAVTFRSLLVTTVPAPAGKAQPPARTLATIGRLSHQRLRIFAHPMPEDFETFEYPGEPDITERWVRVPFPDSRATWRAALIDTAERGCQGLLLPADPRLLDLLRNPDEPDDRRDLQLAQG